MTIPQINDWQLRTLNDLANTNQALYLVRPHTTDPVEEKAQRIQSNNNMDQLVELGLAEDANADGMFNMLINQVKVDSDRELRIFKLTEIGQTMFHRSTIMKKAKLAVN